MTNIAICDDNQTYIDDTLVFLHRYFENIQPAEFNISTYSSGKQLLSEFYSSRFDIIFLDIEMPGQNGFSVANEIRKLDPEVDIVFATYVAEQISQGYRYNAKDYLLKPITQQQINELMNRLQEEKNLRDSLGFYTLKLKSDGSMVRLPISDIIYFESNDKSVITVTQSQRFEQRAQLDNVEHAMRGGRFIRINRSLLINAAHIFKYFGKVVTMSSGEELPVGTKYRKNLKQFLENK